MMKTGETKLRRLLACVLALAMALAVLPAAAATMGGWEGVTVCVLYQDAFGGMQQTYAVRMPEDMGVAYGWWATLPQEALGTQVTVQVMHPDPLYTYWTPGIAGQEAPNLYWFADKNAAAVDSMYQYSLGYSYNGTPQQSEDENDYMKLFLSTLEPPFVYTDDAFGGAMLPAGEEGLSSAPGAELITPDWTGGATAAPATATITVEYVHMNGTLLDRQQKTLSPGSHTLWPESTKVGGLNIVGDYSAQVTVYNDGRTDHATVTFLYEDPYKAPTEAVVTVFIYDTMGNEIAPRQQLTLTEGVYPVEAPHASMVPGYELVSDAVVYVTVNADGTYSPSGDELSFWYRPVQTATAVPEIPSYTAPAQATVTVFIFDTLGNEIAPRQQHTLQAGTHMIEAPAGYETPGYELISEAVLYVTVNPDGSYTPSGDELSFWYSKSEEETVESFVPVTTAPAQQTAWVTLRYLDSRGKAIASEQVIALDNGTHTIEPDYANVPAGYQVKSGTERQTVTVRNGVPTLSSVTFYFDQVQTAPSVFDVTVYYYDTMGSEIAPRETRQLAPGTHWIQPQSVPAGYTLASESAFQLTVGADGSLDRAAEDVGFWYSRVPVEAKKAVINVRYVDGSGRAIAGPFSQELEGGQTYLISPDAAVVPEAYDISGVQPVTVTVSEQGVASPAVVSFVAELRRESFDLPVGVLLERYGVVNDKNVALRSEPYTTKSNTVLGRLQAGDVVYMIASEYNQSGEVWTQIIANGRNGYMKSNFIDPLTPGASQVYAASVGATPVPTFTPQPTPTPTESFIEYITPVPVTQAPALSYAVLTRQAELKTGTGSGEWVLTWLPEEELVYITGTLTDSRTGEMWASVRTLDNLNGYVLYSSLRLASQQEADWRLDLWQQQQATVAPTQLITSTPEPQQRQGLGKTRAYNVPLRSMASEVSSTVTYLPYGKVLNITGQTYTDGVTWHNVIVDGRYGYIRSDLADLMSEAEVKAYWASQQSATPTPTSVPTRSPSASAAMSNYGYVVKDKVNFRTGASTSSGTLGQLNTYAMARVLGTRQSGGETWYNVNYDGKTGYIRGDLFKQMTLAEYNAFRTDGRYEQGLRNNGTEEAGGWLPDEDEVLNNQYGSGGSDLPPYEFEDFVALATEPPLNPTATPTLEPLPGYVNQTGGGSAGSTDSTGGQTGGGAQELPAPGTNVTYTNGDDGGSNVLIWVVVGLLLVVTIGGALAFMQHQRRKAQIAQRAAQRRAQQARGGAGGGRAFARQEPPQQPRTGAYPSYGQSQTPPLFPTTGGIYQDYATQAAQPEENPQPTAAPQQRSAAPVPQRPYARHTGSAEAPATANPPARVGRRTAWQQSHTNDQNE